MPGRSTALTNSSIPAKLQLQWRSRSRCLPSDISRPWIRPGIRGGRWNFRVKRARFAGLARATRFPDGPMDQVGYSARRITWPTSGALPAVWTPCRCGPRDRCLACAEAPKFRSVPCVSPRPRVPGLAAPGLDSDASFHALDGTATITQVRDLTLGIDLAGCRGDPPVSPVDSTR